MRVYQYIDVLHDYDGIGSDIEGISQQLNELNIENFIVARVNSSKKKVLNLSQVRAEKRDVHILHYGGYGFPIDIFLKQKGIKILRFHNITPINFFLPYLDEENILSFSWNYQKSELELYSLVKYSDYIWCDSYFNYKTLEQITKIDLKKVFILPIQKNYFASQNQLISKKPKTIAFIGRLVPNKKIEDLLFILYFLLKIDSNYSLSLIGKRLEIFQSYNTKISKIIKELNLEQNIYFYENITEENKLQILAQTESFLCMSEHEGFCIPILEAMAHNVIIFAYSQDAVLETCRGSGILFKRKNFSKIAQIINSVLNHKTLVQEILDLQKQSLQYYQKLRVKEIFSKIF